MPQNNQWGLPYTNLRLSPSLVPMLGHDPRWDRTYPIESTAELVTAPSRCQPVPMMCPAVASGWIPHQFWVCCVRLFAGSLLPTNLRVLARTTDARLGPVSALLFIETGYVSILRIYYIKTLSSSLNDTRILKREIIIKKEYVVH